MYSNGAVALYVDGKAMCTVGAIPRRMTSSSAKIVLHEIGRRRFTATGHESLLDGILKVQQSWNHHKVHPIHAIYLARQDNYVMHNNSSRKFNDFRRFMEELLKEIPPFSIYIILPTQVPAEYPLYCLSKGLPQISIPTQRKNTRQLNDYFHIVLHAAFTQTSVLRATWNGAPAKPIDIQNKILDAYRAFMRVLDENEYLMQNEDETMKALGDAFEKLSIQAGHEDDKDIIRMESITHQLYMLLIEPEDKGAKTANQNKKIDYVTPKPEGSFELNPLVTDGHYANQKKHFLLEDGTIVDEETFNKKETRCGKCNGIKWENTLKKTLKERQSG